MTRPYELDERELASRLDEMVDVVFGDLASQFMLMPRGNAFVTYEEFRDGYEALRLATNGFLELTLETCWAALRSDSRAFIAIRAILGVTPPEWRDLTTEETGERFSANAARAIDKNVKRSATYFARARPGVTLRRVESMLAAACIALGRGAVEAPEGLIHRLEKIDTVEGLQSVRRVAQDDVPYAVLLYERFLGRPYASHRDAVSELVGDVMETAIEDQLARARVPFRKTKRAERVPGFEQAPDFFVPDEIAPHVVIEAKISSDDGTARDKVARILRLAHMRDDREARGDPTWELIACIDGRGFGVRRQDIRDVLVATRGKLFTAATLQDLIPNTSLSLFAPGA